jgi:hypothetical protein
MIVLQGLVLRHLHQLPFIGKQLGVVQDWAVV